MAEEKHKHTNHLIGEKSPYLQQHAHNPVDWYPWCDEAFVKALEEDKMIFLSIGYATCHWCHVMERESFENEEVASKLRESFISIKVDREELPQVDALYMEFAQSMMISSAGWPLNLILTPDLKPLFAGTYLPLHSKQGITGLFELLQRMSTLWHGEEREQLESQAANLLEMTEENRIISGDEIPPVDFIEETAEMIFKIGDPIYGGLKGHPKFPIGYLQTFLMHYALKSQDGRGLYLAERTLEKMAYGGIFDQLGGGFCRYAVDVKWLTPHFEKMLYDNALLIEAYTNAYRITERPLYKEVVRKTVNYVLRELTAPSGGFYSAEDSEIGGHEGTSNTWLYADVMAALGEEGALFCEYYNITPAGNFGGRNILHIPIPPQEFARKKSLEPTAFEKMIKQKSEMLFKIRNTAPKPLVDKKIITAWNGMMIHSLALAGTQFEEKQWVEAATTAAAFIERELWQGDRLMRRWIDGEAKYPGTLDDYAYILRAYLTLFELDLGSKWLARAIALQNHIGEHFKVPAGAYYQISGDDTSIIMRHVLFSDGAEPSGNAIHCENLLRLYSLSGNRDYLAQAEDILATVTKFLDTYPPGYVYHLMNLQRYYDAGSETFVIALNAEEEGREEIAASLHKLPTPHRTTLWRREDDTTLFQYLPFVKVQEPKEGKTTLYFCEKGVCKEPIVGVEAILETLTHI